MSSITANQALQSLGVTSSPAPTDDLEQTDPKVEQSRILEGPYEVRPNVFFDPSVAEAMGYKETPTSGVLDTIKKAFTGQLESPPPEAFITQDLPNIPIVNAFEDLLPTDVTQTVTSDQMSGLRINQMQRMNDARYARLSEAAQSFGVDVIPGYESDEIAKLIAEKSKA